MADQYKPHERKSDESSAATLAAAEVEAGDRGLFDLLGKKTEEGKKCEGEGVAAELDEKVTVSEEDTKKHESLLDKFSSSDEKEIGEKKKDTNVPIEKFDDKPAAQEAEEKKGFLDKIKEKLPGGKKPEDVASPPPTPALAECHVTPVAEEKEKKGFVDKIKEKIPGQSKGDDHVEKEKEK